MNQLKLASPFSHLMPLKSSTTPAPRVIAIRRDLHTTPELMYKETVTSAKIQTALRALDINFKMGYGRNTKPERIEGAGGTGVIADIGTGKPPTVLLRADMDGLPIDESKRTDLEFRSTHPGRMHACGHDGHTSMLLGAARVLKSMEGNINGTVRLMFQPAEEGGAGGKRMRDEGILEMEPAVERGEGGRRLIERTTRKIEQ